MFLESVHLRDVLSFRDAKIELKNLNVLIGANGSGKSNFLDAIGLLPGIAADAAAFFVAQGGISSWLSKMPDAGAASRFAFEFAAGDQYEAVIGTLDQTPHFYSEQLRTRGGKVATLNRHEADISVRAPLGGFLKGLRPLPHRSILSYPFPIDTDWRTRQDELQFIRTYRLSSLNQIRRGVAAGSAEMHLTSNGENLAEMIHSFYEAEMLDEIDLALRRFGENYQSVKAVLTGQYWGLRLKESRLDGSVSAGRISDGTLRFLQLLAILRHPDPPKLTLIEEPELGLHPDAIGIVAEELLEASNHSQIIVTTHSPELISALQHVPESVLVCEKDFDNATTIRRLDRTSIRRWLKVYSSLGETWRSGAIGGNRW